MPYDAMTPGNTLQIPPHVYQKFEKRWEEWHAIATFAAHGEPRRYGVFKGTCFDRLILLYQLGIEMRNIRRLELDDPRLLHHDFQERLRLHLDNRHADDRRRHR